MLRDLRGDLQQRIAVTAEQLWLTEIQICAASGYYAEFTDEIDTEICDNEKVSDRALAAWENERRLLSG